ncbi:MAG: hypothetical protein LBL57_07305 [Tannerella sp.]|jgi:hypothetical protein|nr:hypothetical protein [Tannerella sp.]
MRTKLFLFSTAMLFMLNGCNDAMENSNIAVCPLANNMVFTCMVDYTTNRFSGGYTLILPRPVDSLKPVCEYHSPGDFGDVTWYDKETGAKLFAGTIVWMGKGERTFPEKTEPPSSFVSLDFSSKTPHLMPLYHDEFDEMMPPEVNYRSVWDAIKNLQNTSWVSSDTPAYIYLYRPSVGAGDPKDWYWIVFLQY